VWTETDVREDSWFLHRGFMPAGIMIEAGQADLFLISYLGVDALNQGRRRYRLLGCELTYHGSLLGWARPFATTSTWTATRARARCACSSSTMTAPATADRR